jgi:Cu/Ag efflux pump CusA
MMKAIISSSLRFRYLVLALSVVLTWFGLARLQDVAVDVFPEFAQAHPLCPCRPNGPL